MQNKFFNFLIIAILLGMLMYPGLNIVLEVDSLFYRVASGSMSHNKSFDSWWESKAYCKYKPCTQEQFYEGYNISKKDFLEFDFKDGLNKGDFLLVKKVNKEDLQVGDVIVFRTPKKKLVHRIISNEHLLKAKGDANTVVLDVDLLVSNEDSGLIIGKVFFKVPSFMEQ